MARLGSRAVAGYFPTPTHLVLRIADLVRVTSAAQEYGSFVVVDPCAGDGAAVLAATAHWTKALRPSNARTVYAAEMEASRCARLASQASRALSDHHIIVKHLCGDGLRVNVGEMGRQQGATVLWLNPPYDTDRDFGRAEHRFLATWTPRLATEGVLVFIVPHVALSASITTLARNYGSVRCFRFPDEDFAAFQQVVLVARRTYTLSQEDIRVRALLKAWDSAPDRIPVLPELGENLANALPVSPVLGHGFPEWERMPLDIASLRRAFEPWHATQHGGVLAPIPGLLPEPAPSLLRGVFPLAMPPRASHIAAALAAGVYSGAEVSPDAPQSKLPRLLLKATFDREWMHREDRMNAKGEVVGELQVQCPKLRVQAIRMDTLALVPLCDGVVPSGSEHLEEFTAGDLLAHYGGAMLDVLRDRCPVTHDPALDEVPAGFPTLARPAYAAQLHAAVAATKILGRGDGSHVLLFGEIGSGKSLTALLVAAARKRRSLLIMCPPHLLTSWAKQIVATYGDVIPHRVFELDSLDSVDEYAAWVRSPSARGVTGIAILSREKAKLGHPWVSITTHACPTCGAPLPPEKSPGERARRRLRCKAVERAPANRAATLATALGNALAPLYPGVGVVREVASRRHVQRCEVIEKAAPLTAERRARLEDTAARTAAWVARAILRSFVRGTASSHDPDRLAMTQMVNAIATIVGDDSLVLLIVEGLLAPGLRDRNDGDWSWSHTIHIALGLLLLVRSPACRTRRDELAERLATMLPARCGPSTSSTMAQWRAALSFERRASSPWGDFTMTEGNRIRFCGMQMTDIEQGDRARLVDVLSKLCEHSAWLDAEPCNAPLFAADASEAGGLRRVPLGQYIARRHRNLFDMMIADEAHELSSETSAQGRSSTRLMGKIADVLHLTGSSSNGYSSSLFTMLWNASPVFRRQYRRDEEGRFVEECGLKKRLRTYKNKDGKTVAFGVHSERVTESFTDKGEAPGVLPQLVLRHLLPIAVTIQKADLKLELAPHDEQVVFVKPDRDLAAAHGALVQRVLDQVKKDAFTPLAGKLYGALATLPSHLDRATTDTGNWSSESPQPTEVELTRFGIEGGALPEGAFVAAYPRSAGPFAHRFVAIAQPFPADALLPKEVELIAVVRKELAEGRRVMVHGYHDNVCARLQRILRESLDEPIARLVADRVAPSKREDWIDREVIGAGARVLVVNPITVQTGLNNLVWFHTSVWFENPMCNPQVFDQATGRIDRIGKALPTKSIFLVYDLPTQRALHRLLMHKAGVLRAVDGLDGESALAAAGAGGDLAFAGMGLGRELYAILTNERAA